MSSDLSIKINPPLDRALLIQDAERIFRELLNIDIVTPFCFLDTGTIGLKKIGQGVSFGCLEVEPDPPWITDEAGIYAFISMGGSHALPFAVAASIGLALAYEHRSHIVDAGSRWVKFSNPLKNDYGCSAITFQQAIANNDKFSNLEAAAAEFHKRLPVFVENPGWTALAI